MQHQIGVLPSQHVLRIEQNVGEHREAKNCKYPRRKQPLPQRRFARKHGVRVHGISPSALAGLKTHDWPGNVRELEGVVHRAAQLADGSAIGSTVVLSVLGGAAAKRRPRARKPPVVRVPVGASLADVERRLIQKTLEFARGNKPKAAQLLKLSLKTIYNKIKEYGLEH